MHTRAVSSFIIATFAATTALALACRDDTTAPGASAPRADRAPSRITQPHVVPGADARAELRKANPLDWVGAAHNAALDAFLEDLGKPGVLTKDICGHILDFSARDERVPADRRAIVNRLSPAARRGAVRKALATSSLCGAPGQSASAPAKLARLGHVARQSSAAYNLLSQVEYAINAATSSYDLAARLNPILNAATSLPYDEYATVAATVSVAQSSYEYWQTGYRTYYDGIRRDYGACADQMKYAGYSAYDARNYCMGSASTTKNYSELRRPRDGTAGGPVALMFLRATSPTVQCIGPGAGLKQIGRDDARGAFTAGFAGLLIGGPEAAVLAGIAGGAANSIATGIGLVWNEMWNCGGGSGATKTYR
jgi:hypothetical protein